MSISKNVLFIFVPIIFIVIIACIYYSIKKDHEIEERIKRIKYFLINSKTKLNSIVPENI